MNSVRRFILASAVCALAATTAPGAEIALIPVGASGGHSINGNEITLTSGGQRIFLEFRASGWAPDSIRLFQVSLDGAGFTSGSSGSVGLAAAACSSSDDCIGAFGGTCSVFGDACVQSGDCQLPQYEDCEGPPCANPTGVDGSCNPVFISDSRGDYVFWNLVDLAAVDLANANIRLASTLFESTDAVSDSGAEVYLGTLVLDASPDAQGTFVIDYVTRPDASFLWAPNNVPVAPLTLSPARITFACSTDADCVDADQCTSDVCDVTGACVHSPNYGEATECCNPDDGSVCSKPTDLAGDFNGDGAVDLSDFSQLQRCFGGVAQGLACEAVDMDCNCTIDVADVAAFVIELAGP